MSKKGPYTGLTVKELIRDADEARKSGKFKWLQEYCPTCHAITFVPEPEGYMYCHSCGRKRSQYAKTNHIVDADKMIIDSLSKAKAADGCTCKDCDCTGKYCEECGGAANVTKDLRSDNSTINTDLKETADKQLTNEKTGINTLLAQPEEELARIFNRTDDKEELYREVSEMIKKLQPAPLEDK